MRVLLILLLSLAVCPALAAVQQPEFDPMLGRQIDMSTSLTDETGRTATLETFTAGRPALILFGWRRHRGFHAWALLVPGLVLIWVGAFSPLHNHSMSHAVVMTIGGLLLALAHLVNLRLTHSVAAARP